ncbi:hypothetical protein [Yersinia mollaretii]|uniref:hypothetical protein n=1 Tax=Yersinia mollaretii TaxID=33060 RepID=UPI0011AA1BB1|nr:hypothetical protein [Yersinia mollaretii]
MRPIYNATIQPVISSNLICKENKILKPSINIDSVKNTSTKLNRYGGELLCVLSKSAITEAGNINTIKNKENKTKSDNYSTLNKQGSLFKGIFQNTSPSKPGYITSRFTNIKNSDSKAQYDIQRSAKKEQINVSQDLEWDYENNIIVSTENTPINIKKYDDFFLDALSKKPSTADNMSGFEEDNDIYIIGDKGNKIGKWAFSNSDTDSNSKDIKQDELLSSESLNESDPLNKNLNMKMNHGYYTITVNPDEYD